MESRLYDEFKKQQTSGPADTRGQLVHRVGNETVRLMMEAVTDEEFKNMSVLGKMKFLANRRAIDPVRLRQSFYFATFLFWTVAIAELYVTLNYTIADLFPNVSAETTYLLKVVTCFVFYNALANWLCTVCYSSYYSETKDRPDLEKKLWDATVPTQPQRQLVDTKIKDNGVRGGSSYMLRYIPDVHSGLQWRRCIVCQHDAPPRCHHCPICQRCVLKRDHHCYMTGVCIGYYNQRYFVILCFYVLIGCFIGGYAQYNYLKNHYAPIMQSKWELFLPITVYYTFFGHIPSHVLLMIMQLYCFLFMGPMSIGFSVFQWYSIFTGKTVFEIRQSHDIVVKWSLSRRFADVFGRLWFLNFIFPTQLLFKQEGDGKNWLDTYDRDALKKMRAENGTTSVNNSSIIKVSHTA